MKEIIMKSKKLEQAPLFQSLIRKEISQKAAGEPLRLCPRQIKRFKAGRLIKH